MIFSSLTFLFLFLPVFLAVYYFLPLKAKNIFISFSSLFFLSWAGTGFTLVLLLSFLFNFFLGILIEKKKIKDLAKPWLIFSVILNLLILIIFKYAAFLLGNLDIIIVSLGLPQFTVPDWLLPLGISFYTFRMLSYQIEIFRGKVTATRHPGDLLLYISFFPQLAAGPIVRFSEFCFQIKGRRINLLMVKNGAWRFLLGLAKKVLLANSFGIVADAVFALPGHDLALTTSWLGTMAYTLQIYYDFSAYSDMAIGLSKMLGFSCPENFNFPYRAVSVQDFWRRWHMTLTRWFRDFLFLPLAFTCSRKMPAQHYGRINTDILIYSFTILITWFMVGLWHGANWTFIAWGVTFGIFLILEHLGFGKKIKKTGKWIQHLYSMAIVMIAWIFFRADNFQQGFEMIRGLTGGNGIDSETFAYYRYFTPWFILTAIIGILGAAGVLDNFRKFAWKSVCKKEQLTGVPFKLIFRSLTAFLLLMGFALAVSEILKGAYTPFIYFKF